MITQVLHCPYCDETDIVRHGKSPEGKQRYRCRQCLEGRGRTFLLEYAYAGQSPTIKQQIVDRLPLRIGEIYYARLYSLC
jgi:transposase-like protein